jgi:hypothetical protein
MAQNECAIRRTKIIFPRRNICREAELPQYETSATLGSEIH